MQQFSYEDILHRVAYREPNRDRLNRHESVRAYARDMMSHLADVCPHGRELSLAFTKLEEAMFWANAAIAREGRVHEE